MNEQERKRENNVFSGNGGMGRECSMCVKKLSQLISAKQKEGLSVVTYGTRCNIS